MDINNLIVISDPHCGCRLGLCPPGKIRLDDGGFYIRSELQAKVWAWWKEFWGEWVPHVTHGEPYSIAINGDAIDGVHHNSTTQISHNLEDQARIAQLALEPIIDKCKGKLFWVRGTEAHVGKSGVEEERLAKSLGAVPNDVGQHARHELWINVGGGLCHIMHHIGTTGSSHYESTAIMKELTESYTESGRWGLRPPNVVVRSHRHRHAEIRIPTASGYDYSIVTAGWQLKTPFVYRIPGGRVTTPQIGGSLIRQGDEDLYTRHFTRSIGRPKIENA